MKFLLLLLLIALLLFVLFTPTKYCESGHNTRVLVPMSSYIIMVGDIAVTMNNPSHYESRFVCDVYSSPKSYIDKLKAPK